MIKSCVPVLTVSNNSLFPLIPGIGISASLLLGAVVWFNSKQL
jgi:hypothetical protein